MKVSILSTLLFKEIAKSAFEILTRLSNHKVKKDF